MQSFGVTDYTILAPLKCCGWTDRRKIGRMDVWSGPTTRPAFAKATQVKIWGSMPRDPPSTSVNPHRISATYAPGM